MWSIILEPLNECQEGGDKKVMYFAVMYSTRRNSYRVGF